MSTPGVTAIQTSRTYSTQLNPIQPATEYFYRIESRNMFESIFTDTEPFTTRDGSKYNTND